MKNLFAIIPLLGFFTALYFLAYIIKVKNRTTGLKWFIIFLISTQLYLLDVFIYYNSANIQVIDFFIRFLAIIVVTAVVSFVNFLLSLVLNKKYPVTIALLLYIPILLYIYFFNTPYIIAEIFHTNLGFAFRGGTIAKLMGPYNVILLSTTLIIFLKKIKTTTDRYLKQLFKRLLFYILIPILCATIFDGVVVVYQFIHIPFGFSSLIILYFIISLFYIVVKFGLKKPIIEVNNDNIPQLALFLFLIFFLLPGLLIFSNEKFFLYYAIIFIVGTLFLYTLILKLIKLLLLQEEKRFNKVKKKFKASMMFNTNINDSAHQFIDMVQYIMRTEYVVLYLFLDKAMHIYYKKVGESIKCIKKKLIIKRLRSFINGISNYMSVNEPIIKRKDIPQVMREIITKYNGELIFPLERDNKNIGFILISSKPDNSIFTNLEINILTDLVSHFNILIITNLLYREILKVEQLEIFKQVALYTSHELKNLISGLNFLLQNFKNNYKKRSLPLKDYFVNTIAETIKQMNNLILNIKNSGYTTRKEVFQNINLKKSIKAILKKFEIVNQKIKTQLQEHDDNIRIKGSLSQINQLFTNLIKNSYEAVKGKRHGLITIGIFRDKKNVIVKISDNGNGMNEKYIKKELFKPFATTKEDGMGIGLYICKSIMEFHNGKINIISKQNVGTEVELIFPS